MVPKVERAEKLLSLYSRDNSEMKECVRSFDEKLCLKVNTWNLNDLKTSLQEDYVQQSKLEAIQSELHRSLQDFKSKSESLVHDVEKFKKELNRSVKTICEDVVEDKLEIYHGVATNFAQFFSAENLKKRFEEKMDISSFEKQHTHLA